MDDLSNVTQEYLREYINILQTMMDEMTSVDISNSISANFILQMIPHHEAAIKMCNNLLRFTTNVELQNVANEIIVTQTNGIESMMRAYSRCSTVLNTNTDVVNYQNAYRAITESMFNSMSHAEMTDNIDVDFISEMIPHHLGAIAMSRNALRFDICIELNKILNDIIISQSRGVVQMRNILQQINEAS